ncbi:MAG: hypothetical protein CMN32_07330 [Saprospirales bacterium]|jgi:hypothetical protein|nr:hypothetical protein [Saprospirales bacterium]
MRISLSIVTIALLLAMVWAASLHAQDRPFIQAKKYGIEEGLSRRDVRGTGTGSGNWTFCRGLTFVMLNYK